MRNTGKKLVCQLPDNSPLSVCMGGNRYKLSHISPNKGHHKISQAKRCKGRQRSSRTTIGSFLSKRRASNLSGDGTKDKTTDKKLHILQKASDHNNSYKKMQKPSSLSYKANKKHGHGELGVRKIKKRRKKRRSKDNNQRDEASRLQRRIRYLLIKMKLEQNLIDAYSAEGWKGQSREKIKPEKELQRAEKQILECKLGIRDVIRQLDLLSSDGRIEDSVIDPDGRVFHEHIFCAKCKLREAFLDNDIILCDGSCNRAFHQKCLDPPLATENIPPDDQGWFCKYCECKMEILEAINAHLCTQFSVNSNWQDIFKEVVNVPNSGNASNSLAEEWPSDDSEDDDYNPQRNDENHSGDDIAESISDDCSGSGDSSWSYDETSSLCEGAVENDTNGRLSRSMGEKSNVIGVDSGVDLHTDDTFECEITNFRRQRKNVDYQKLYDEMFGKDIMENDQLSEDEDWGPSRRKRSVKEPDEKISSDRNNSLTNEVSQESNQILPSGSQNKKSLFRIPVDAVEKLRQVFAENELPSRDLRESLSRQLGIAPEKVSKWFKNARYMALRNRKQEGEKGLCPVAIRDELISENNNTDKAISKADVFFTSLVDGFHVPKNTRKVRSGRKPKSLITSDMKKCKITADALPSNAVEKLKAVLSAKLPPSTYVKRRLSKQLGIPYQEVNMWFNKKEHHKKQMRSSARKATEINGMLNKVLPVTETSSREQLYMIQLERLCYLKDRIEELKKHLRTCSTKSHVGNGTHGSKQLVVYVPIAEVREKV